ncbi:fructose-bisphosphate aldolase class I [Luteibacter anthropi]|uniref:Probable fructose-bisphosphate aldolase class 1 n=1 Tax=Luteibacter anthropi TaxID=564369 RepID=A0A7X5ZK19_9GAMM|nr:class I fructose-bisphosphate aldolase [Luteibacter anthropi]NII08557.1 fructose-bisphosphate aldolase class I [Luteibacter anthropi]URX63060.1 fructose-bisphosphate aldolase class I [Luteibacter anthropi]
MSIDNLEQIAQAMVAPGKGIIAVDESTSTIKKRLEAVGLENNEENRRAYRELLLTAPGLGQYISGAILFDETIRQKTGDGRSMVEAMEAAGIIPGIKVDKGTHPLAGFPDEVVTEGLDGLRERLQEYAKLGAKFAKWRAVIKITDGTPTSAAVEANVHALARYASLCQEAGIVPMVEPEILMDDKESVHDIDTSYTVHEEVLRALFGQLALFNVNLRGLILKVSMVIPGKYAPAEEQVDVEDVAQATVDVFQNAVPASVAGIVFLSGGQSDEQATAHLDAINKLGPHPWPISFSYGRALVSKALDVWSKDQKANWKAGQETVVERAKENSDAAKGNWKKRA